MSPGDTKRVPEYGTDEYLDASTNMRHYGKMRFAQLTLFFASTAGLMALVFAPRKEPLSTIDSTLIAILACVLAGVFYVMERRAARLFDHYEGEAKKFESEFSLDLRQHTNRADGDRSETLLTSARAVKCLYIATVLFWLGHLIGRLVT